jgi:hypothetical protein
VDSDRQSARNARVREGACEGGAGAQKIAALPRSA